jgi:hypothetical protein
MGIDTLYRDSAVEKIITAIDENVPVALIRHRRKQLECAETTGR